MQDLRPRDRSRQRAFARRQRKTLAHHRHPLPLHGARGQCHGAEGDRHSRRRRDAQCQCPCQRSDQKHPAAARQDRFSETDRSRHKAGRHGPRRHRRAGDLALSRSLRLCRAARSRARQLPYGQRPHREPRRKASGQADGHGHGAAAGSRHGGGRTRPHRQRAGFSRRRTLHQCQGRRSHPGGTRKVLCTGGRTRRDDFPASVRHQPGRTHERPLFPEHHRTSAGFRRFASDN